MSEQNLTLLPTHITDEEGPPLRGLPDSALPETIDSVDPARLKEELIKGLACLEAGLFSQAKHESNTVKCFNPVIGAIEKVISKLDTSDLSPRDAIHLYGVISKYKHQSLSFLLELHDKSAKGIEALTQIEKFKNDSIIPDRDKDGPVKTQALAQVQSIIAQKIREKVEASKK